MTDRLLEEFYLPTGPLLIYSACTTIGPPGNQHKVVQIPGVPLHKNVLEVDRISWIAWIYFCTCLPVSTDVCCNFTVRLIKQLHVWGAANRGYEITVPYRISCILAHWVIMGSIHHLTLWFHGVMLRNFVYACVWHLMTLLQDYECNAGISNSCQKPGIFYIRWLAKWTLENLAFPAAPNPIFNYKTF